MGLGGKACVPGSAACRPRRGTAPTHARGASRTLRAGTPDPDASAGSRGPVRWEGRTAGTGAARTRVSEGHGALRAPDPSFLSIPGEDGPTERLKIAWEAFRGALAPPLLLDYS